MKQLVKPLSLLLTGYLIGKGVNKMAKHRKKYRFTADSEVVKFWVFAIKTGQATMDDAPDTLNLIELVASILKLEEVIEPEGEQPNI